MKGVSDFFISKDKLAYFWFLVSCAIIAGTAWYANDVAGTSKAQMLYVVMNSPEVRYLDKDLSVDEAKDLFNAQARLAVETLLNRGPSGPLNMQRLRKLYGEGALQGFIMPDLAENREAFFSKQFHQMAEVDSVEVFLGEDGGAITVATGQLIRVGVDQVEAKVINQVHSFKVRLVFESNPNMRDSRMVPFVVKEVSYVLSLVSES